MMQTACFPHKIEYMSISPQNVRNVPKLVKTLKLFLDSKGILRSRRRIEQSNSFSFNCVNLILFGKSHPLTSLLILDAHNTCKHLRVEFSQNYVRQSGCKILQARQAVLKVI